MTPDERENAGISDLLPELSPKVARRLSEIGDCLDVIMRFGTEAIEWSTTGARRTPGDVATVMMYRRLLALVGGLSAQIRGGWTESATITLRALLEAFLYLEYLVEKDHERRGCAFLTVERHTHLAFLRKLDPSRAEGETFRKKHREDRLVGNTEFVWPQDVTRELRELEALVLEAEMRTAEEEYKALWKERGRRPRWYSLFSRELGSIEALGSHLGFESIYDGIYRLLSGDVHSTSILRGYLRARVDGKSDILPLKTDFAARGVALSGAMLAIRATKDYVKHFVPDKMVVFQDWYSKSIKARLEELDEPAVTPTGPAEEGTPPVQELNREERAHVSGAARTSRNARCPCGSGKKYKKCHGAASLPLKSSNG